MRLASTSCGSRAVACRARRRESCSDGIDLSVHGEVHGQGVRCVAVEVVPSSVIPPRCTGVGVTGEVLNVPQRHSSVQGCRDRRVAQRVRADALGDARCLGQPSDDSSRIVAVETFTRVVQEERSGGPVLERPPEGCDLPATSGIVARLPPLPVTLSTWCPRSLSRSSTLAERLRIRADRS